VPLASIFDTFLDILTIQDIQSVHTHDITPIIQLSADDPMPSADGIRVLDRSGRERVRWRMGIRGAEKGYCAGSRLREVGHLQFL